MNNDRKIAKRIMKEQCLPYQIYGYYLSIPIVLIGLLMLSFLGINLPSTVGNVIFIFTILSNVGVRKLSLVSKRKYVAPILTYTANGLSLILLFAFLRGGLMGYDFFSLMGLLMFPIEIVAIVFFLITANDIKKVYPTMKESAQEARRIYRA